LFAPAAGTSALNVDLELYFSGRVSCLVGFLSGSVDKPAGAQVRNADGLKTQRPRCANFQLCIDLCRQLPRDVLIGADARPPAQALVVIAQVPDFAAEIRLDFSDAKRRLALGHAILRESSRYKTPQKLPQTGISEDVSEWQRLKYQ